MRDDERHLFKSRSFRESVGFALSGLRLVIRMERNFRTHIALAIVTAAAGWILQVNRLEWALLVLCMAVMMAVEILNTAIEHFTDRVSGGMYDETIRRVKDISAGACLLTAVGVAIAGSLILLPHLLHRMFAGNF